MIFARHDLTATELAQMMEAERSGEPFVMFRDVSAAVQLVPLSGDRLVIGREAENDLAVPWDVEVSRVHALLERLAGSWTVVDDDLSRNGTFVNGNRVRGRRRLNDRDVVRVGVTQILFCDPSADAGETPQVASAAAVAAVSPAQHRVLVALCGPFLGVAEPGATPPSNAELAATLNVSTEAVRSQLKALFRIFEVPDLPQNRKRAELARRVLASGVVSPRDMES